MVLLELIGVALGAAIINDMAKKSSMKANPRLNTTRFDANNARYGVASSSSGFTKQKIIDIAARCGVRPNKYGVLPEDGWKRCLKYVSEYVNHPDDVANFERDWRMTVASQLKDKSAKMIEENWAGYQHQYNGYLNNKEHWTSGPDIVLEFKHWHGLSRDQHLKRLKDIQTKTFWGELCLQDPILRKNPRIDNSYVEVWVMKGSKHDKQGDWLTHNAWNMTYKRCCGVCGYDSML